MIGTRQVELALLHHHPRCAGWHGVLVFATCGIVSLTAGGCGSDGPLAPAPGSGSLTATGALSLSGSGPANFQISGGGRQPTFAILIYHFINSEVDWQLQIVKNNSGLLEVGTYDLVPLSASVTNPTAILAHYLGAAANPPWLSFNSTSGQLVITSSSPSEVRGTFTFTGTEYGGTGSVSVTGAFDACAAVCP